MPTYDYQCEECGHTFEEILKIADRNVPCETPCKQDKCNGEIHQVMHAPYFGYDNIKTKHSQNNKVPSWYTDKIKDLKNSKRFPNNNL